MLWKYRHKSIMLIAHSMGSIIAFDILGSRENNQSKKYQVHTFVTIGSPLGLPIFIKKYLQENGYNSKSRSMRTPDSITHKWLNFSDLEDPVAINYKLSDDLGANTSGLVVDDTAVLNTYNYNAVKDKHSDIGYLRTPQMALYEFLNLPRKKISADCKATILAKLRKKINN